MANVMALIQPQFVNTTLNATEPLKFGGTAGASGFAYFKETASQTYLVDDLVYLDPNGTVAICTTTSGATNGNVLNSAVLGQADANATGVTGAQVSGHVIRPDDIYVMNVFHHTVGSAVSAQTQLGTVRGIRRTTGSDNTQGAVVWAVDIENAVESSSVALAYVQIIGFPTQGLNSAGAPIQTAGIGDTYGLVYVKFLTYSFNTTINGFQRNLQMGG